LCAKVLLFFDICKKKHPKRWKTCNLSIIFACGIGIGLLCSFFVEIYLYKKYGKQTPAPEDTTPNTPAE
jgi:hypothetical protein